MEAQEAVELWASHQLSTDLTTPRNTAVPVTHYACLISFLGCKLILEIQVQFFL